jgi:hypothetical protein
MLIFIFGLTSLLFWMWFAHNILGFDDPFRVFVAAPFVIFCFVLCIGVIYRAVTGLTLF